jgi:hypothetical protein
VAVGTNCTSPHDEWECTSEELPGGANSKKMFLSCMSPGQAWGLNATSVLKKSKNQVLVHPLTSIFLNDNFGSENFETPLHFLGSAEEGYLSTTSSRATSTLALSAD